MAERTGRAGNGFSEQGFRPIDYFRITIFGFALAALWSSLHTIILQVRLLDLVDGSQKNTYLGLLTFAGLLIAMAVQPIIGSISDRSGFRWGRRRPYILIGTIATLLLLPGMGLATGYLVLFIVYCLLQISTNIAQGPFQALIPDLVPPEKRGRVSGVKSLLEAAGGIIILYPAGRFLNRYASEGGDFWLWLTLGLLSLILLAIMLYTVQTVRERPGVPGLPFEFKRTVLRSFKINTHADSGFIFFLASRFLILVAFIIVQRYALFFLMDFLKIENAVAVNSRLLIVIGLCMLATAYPAGRLADRVGRRPVVIASGLLGALGITTLFFTGSMLSLMIAGGILGIAFGGFMSANWALATELVTKSQEARYLGLVNLATAGGGAVVGLTGLLIDLLNADIPGLGYRVMLLVCFICFLAGSALVMKARPRSVEVG